MCTCVHICVSKGRILKYLYTESIVIERGVDNAVQDFLRNLWDELAFIGDNSSVIGENTVWQMEGLLIWWWEDKGILIWWGFFCFSVKHKIKLNDA